MTFSEENYLKAIYYLSGGSDREITTNAIAERIETKASSVTDMLKKLAEKQLIIYRKYQGVALSEQGSLAARMIIRKHRLWEVFLVDKLDFPWDEVHEIAEQLEHIKSEKLINRLDAFLGHPSQDPHGDPIPDAEGEIKKTEKEILADLALNKKSICVGVKDSSSDFLKYLDKQKISLGSELEILDKETFDQTFNIRLNGEQKTISFKIAANLYVKPI